MHDHRFLLDLGIAMAAALVGGLVARTLRLPVLIGYLLAGIAVGPHTPGFVADASTVRSVAQLGVAFLMFAVGVHFSLTDLRRMLRTALLGGCVQILTTGVLGLALGAALGWGAYGGLFLGCALALSSTAVMMKVLEDRGELGTAHGSVMLGILIVQDLSLVAMVIVLPAVALLQTATTGAGSAIGYAFLKAILFLLATYLLAVRVVPRVMHWVVRTGSRELFLLTALCICLGAAVAADLAGLGLELGAFIAGLVISETDYSHEVFAQMRPLRDVFASLFFVSVGMLLDPVFVLRNWSAVGLVVLAILIGKTLVAGLAVYACGWHGRTALLVGLGLGNIGEFSFVLATIGSSRNLIPSEISKVILASALITLLFAPLLYQAASHVYGSLNAVPLLSRWLNRQSAPEVTLPMDDCASARALVVGYGRVGRYVSHALRAVDIQHVVVDFDAGALERARDEDVRLVYGDATSEPVLQHAMPACAELGVVSLPDIEATLAAIRLVKAQNPRLQVIARVHRGEHIPAAREAGADAVIHAEFEAGIAMIRLTMERLEVPDAVVDQYVDAVRQHRYRDISGATTAE